MVGPILVTIAATAFFSYLDYRSQRRAYDAYLAEREEIISRYAALVDHEG